MVAVEAMAGVTLRKEYGHLKFRALREALLKAARPSGRRADGDAPDGDAPDGDALEENGANDEALYGTISSSAFDGDAEC